MSLTDLADVTGQRAAGGGAVRPTGRIGIAIPVPGALGEQLQQRRAEAGDPLAWSVPPHVTLVPPVEVGQSVMPRVHGHLERVAARTAPFRIRLRGTGTFRPVSPVVYLRLVAGGAAVTRLEEQVRSGVPSGPRRFPFHPHVTLAQAVDDAALDRAGAELAGFGASFTAACFVLYRHDDDGVWRPSVDYRLG